MAKLKLLVFLIILVIVFEVATDVIFQQDMKTKAAENSLSLELDYDDEEYQISNNVKKRQQSSSGPGSTFPYSKCHVSYGFQDNPQCSHGEVCVDKVSIKKVGCLLGNGVDCPACSSSSNPSPSACPRGCRPGSGCPALSTPEDGVCKDPQRHPDEYDDETTAAPIGPLLIRPGALEKGAECNAYGDLINEGRIPNGEICNWAKARLQCIPNEPRKPHPSGSLPQTQEEIEAGKRPPGTCQCMLALSEKAVSVKNPNTGIETCYIPANNGRHSECDYTVSPPYGLAEGINSNGVPIVKTGEPASKFCVPHSECRVGETYTGRRCMCREGSLFDHKTFSCSKAETLKFQRKVFFGMFATLIAQTLLMTI